MIRIPEDIEKEIEEIRHDLWYACETRGMEYVIKHLRELSVELDRSLTYWRSHYVT